MVLGQLIINDLRSSVFKSVLKQDMAFFDKNKVCSMFSWVVYGFVVGVVVVVSVINHNVVCR